MNNYSGNAYQKIKILDLENHKFDVSIEGQTGSTQSSQELKVNSINNSMPVVVMISPSEVNLASGVVIDFAHASYDEDDLLEITWDFGDGSNYTVYNYSTVLTLGLGNIQHIYNNSGIYTITLRAKEMTRNQSSSVTRTIYVFKEGINVFPIITSPQVGVNYGNFVNFNASQSFVANCSSSLSSSDFEAGSLKCKYLLAPGNTTLVGNGNLSVSWNVYSGSNGALSLSKNGNWNTNYSDIVQFTQFFERADTHRAVLSLDYN